MRTHPEVGERILQPIQSLQAILPIVRHHHERWDGYGLPGPARGTRDPARGRIVAVCDAFRAMTEDRPYRASLEEAEALSELRSCAGSQFDPDCVEALMHALDRRGGEATVVALRPPSVEPSPPAQAE